MFRRTVFQLFTCSWLVAMFSLLLSSCGRDYSPKPHGFPRLNLPPHQYQTLQGNYPYEFEFSKYATVYPDTFAKAEPYWIFVHYPLFKASVQLTYKPVMNSQERLKNMIDDAHRLSFKHNVKAYSIQETTLQTKSGRTVGLIRLLGEVPSHLQFYTTDSTKHFMRGAFYLSSATDNDSLQPVIDYVRQDMMHLLNTLKWKQR
ncbi:MAG: gliding motility lipoprotein GldD [Spirosomataceae bacterium]